jgi:hypothetical protein
VTIKLSPKTPDNEKQPEPLKAPHPAFAALKAMLKDAAPVAPEGTPEAK